MRRAEMGYRHCQVALRLGEGGKAEVRARHFEPRCQCGEGPQGLFETTLRLLQAIPGLGRTAQGTLGPSDGVAVLCVLTDLQPLARQLVGLVEIPLAR
jgi:hypothetical protein